MKFDHIPEIGVLILSLGVAGLGADAHAGLPSIEGSLSFQGIPVLNGPVATATAITNFSSATIASGAPGAYAGLGGLAAGWLPFHFPRLWCR